MFVDSEVAAGYVFGRELAMQFNIRSIPTMIVFKNGKEVNRISGALPGAQIQQWIKQNI